MQNTRVCMCVCVCVCVYVVLDVPFFPNTVYLKHNGMKIKVKHLHVSTGKQLSSVCIL